MIITVTPNPGIDRTLELDRLVRGAVNRVSGGRVDPGGKGINVSRALLGHGIVTAAVAPLGGADGTRLAGLLADGGIEVRAVAIGGPTRTNVTITEPAGTTTKINEPGPCLTAGEVRALRRAVLDTAGPRDWVVCCGSLPRGVDPGFFAALAAPLHERGARVVLDTSGPALRAAVAPASPGQGCLPDLVKPNHEELSEAVARPLPTLGDVVTAARELHERGIETVLASLGPEGAVLVDGAGAVHAEARVERPRSTVGAGDALLAGYLSVAARGPAGTAPASPAASPPDAATAREALVAAVAWGAAATGLPGSRMPGPNDVAAVTVAVHDRCDPQRRLGGATE